MKNNSLSDLLMAELADLLSAEQLLSEALPKIGQAIESSNLKTALSSQLKIKKDHMDSLQKIFTVTSQYPSRITCRAIEELIKESQDMINLSERGMARDAVIINIMQQAQRYKITEYSTAREHAAELGHSRIVQIIDKLLNEERSMNLTLSEVAQAMINLQALKPKPASKPKQTKPPAQSGGFYLPERFKKGIPQKPKGPKGPRFKTDPPKEGDKGQ